MEKFVAAGGILLTPSSILGDVVWPALYAETKMNSIPVIALSLVLEFLVIQALFKRSITVSTIMVIVANAASGLIGCILRPLSGIAWEFSVGALFMWVFDWGTFNPVTWFFVPIIGGAINAAIELLTIKLIWKQKFSRNNFLAFWAVNWATVGIAVVWVIVSPPTL